MFLWSITKCYKLYLKLVQALDEAAYTLSSNMSWVPLWHNDMRLTKVKNV